MAFDRQGRRTYTEKQHLALCRGINWIDGRREVCNAKAEHHIGHEALGYFYDLGFCELHWRALVKAVELDIQGNGDELGHWIIAAVMKRHRSTYDERRARFLDEQRAATEANIARFGQMARGTSVVYFVQTGEHGPIKIGTSKNFAVRLSLLQTGSPYPLYLRALTAGDVQLEAAYHTLLAPYRLHGEWFEPSAEILATIEQLNARASTRPSLAVVHP